MSLFVLSRRTITFKQVSAGETTVLLVPGIDQVQVIKDMAGTNTLKDPGAAKAGVGSRQLKQLSRVLAGQRYIYGYLPEEIAELSTAVKVWLAEDFAPAGCQAFFFVFSNSVVIHGVREQNDEGQLSWRTAQLVLPQRDALSTIINAISDYALANGSDALTVAVFNQLELYQQLQEGLKTYGVSPVPFSRMQPVSGVKPLYRHLDYTILYLTLALFGVIIFAASGVYLYYTYHKRNALDDQIHRVQTDIRNIKRTKSIGDVQDPQSVLESMGKPLKQMPSAIIEAAASAGRQFGDLTSINLSPGPSSEDNENMQDVQASLVNMKDTLLLDQEERGHQLVAQRPWVRVAKRRGTVGESGDIILALQVDQAPSATTVLADDAAREPLPTTVSGTDGKVVSATAATSSTEGAGQ